MNRTSQQRIFRVAVHGLPHFCRKLSQLLDGDGWSIPYRSPFHPAGLAARFADLARCDLAYSWTGKINMGKFLWTARALGKKRIVLLWCGSDVLFAREELKQGKMDPWVCQHTHWAVSPWLAEEVCSLGIRCEYVQASFVPPVSPSSLPEKFSVLVYAPSMKKGQLYGVDLILAVAKKLPSIEFKLVGVQEGTISSPLANLHIAGQVNLDPYYRQASVIWRPVRHDGLSFMVLEALAHGRHVLYSYPFPGCIHVADAAAACRELERLRDLHTSRKLELNENGRQFVARDFAPEVVRERLLRRWKEIIVAPEHSASPSRAEAHSNS